MSRYGRGTVTLERGRYRVRVSVRGRYRTVGHYDTIEEAEQMRETALLARASFTDAPTLRDWGKRWLPRIRHQRNFRSWSLLWQNHVLRAPFADDPIDSITTADVDAWCRELPECRARRTLLRDGQRTTVELGHAISRSTALQALGLLMRALRDATREGHIERNPAEGARLPTERKRRGGALEYLPVDDVARLLRSKRIPSEVRVVLTIAIFQGLRQREIATLQWDALDWNKLGWWIEDAKSGAMRWQLLRPVIVPRLRAWWRLRGRPTRGLVFPARRGRAPIQRGYSARERPYALHHDWGWADHKSAHVTRFGLWRLAGVRTEITFHGLRDTCATHFLSGTWEPNWDLTRVSKYLGHSDPRVTYQRYAHLTDQAQRPAENVPRRISQVLAPPEEIESPTCGLGISGAIESLPREPADPAVLRQVCGVVASALIAEVAAGREPSCRDLLRLAAAALDSGQGGDLPARLLAAEGEMALTLALRLAEAVERPAPAHRRSETG